MRDRAMAEAFSTLEEEDPEVAGILMINLGDRRRAARWMWMSQRLLDGRTAYQALAEGDLDCLWDVLAGSPPKDALSDAFD